MGLCKETGTVVLMTGDGQYDVAGVAQIQNVSGEYYWITQAGQGFSARGYQLEFMRFWNV